MVCSVDKDSSDRIIGPAGVEKFCQDLQVDPEDVSVFVSTCQSAFIVLYPSMKVLALS